MVKKEQSYMFFLVFGAIVLLLNFGLWMFFQSKENESCPVIECPTTTLPKLECPQPSKYEKLKYRLFYLYPKKCKDCNFTIVDFIAYKIGMDIDKVQSDEVPRPALLIISRGRASLADATSAFNMLNAICQEIGNKVACEMREYVNISKIYECLDFFNISHDAVFFMYDDRCRWCSKMKRYVRDLEKEGYKFYWAYRYNSSQMLPVSFCMGEIMDEKGIVPQFACPSTRELHLGAFLNETELRDFAERCKNAAINSTNSSS